MKNRFAEVFIFWQTILSTKNKNQIWTAKIPSGSPTALATSDTHRHPQQSTVDQNQKHCASLELLVLRDVVHLGSEACSVCKQRKHSCTYDFNNFVNLYCYMVNFEIKSGSVFFSKTSWYQERWYVYGWHVTYILSGVISRV